MVNNIKIKGHLQGKQIDNLTSSIITELNLSKEIKYLCLAVEAQGNHKFSLSNQDPELCKVKTEIHMETEAQRQEALNKLAEDMRML